MRALMLAMVALAAACSEEQVCDPASNFGCPAEQQCEPVAGGDPRCLPPVVVRGKVRDNAGLAMVPGARIVAYDPDGVALTTAATSVPDGSYELRVRAPRDSSLRPLSRQLRLRASAPGYGVYPDGWRAWSVLDLAGATRLEPLSDGAGYVLTTADTDLPLIAFAGGQGIGTLCGTVPVQAGKPAPLVVAEVGPPSPSARAVTAFTDEKGAFLLFALPPGPVRVRAYARGASTGEVPLDLMAGENACRDLAADGGTLARVSGQVELGGTASGTPTVSLVVASSYDAARATGAQPPGLRVSIGGDGSFAVDGVPAGSYVVLASAENDGLVQVAAPPRVEVSGAAFALGEKIRLAPALATIGPGADTPQGVKGAPTLAWGDSQLEESYRVRVVSYLGQEIFNRTERKHAGDNPLLLMDSQIFAGMLYRFTVEALDDRGLVITRNETGRGIFFPMP